MLRPDPVGVDELIDLIWPDELPQDPRSSLQVIATRARQTLEPHGERLSTAGDRYSLSASSDALRLLAISDQLTNESMSVHPEELRSALSLWRGPPFDGLPTRNVFGPAMHRLLSAHGSIQRELLRALHDERQHSEVIAIAGPIVDEEPTREFEAALLARSLAAIGQRRRALAVLSATRRSLVLAGLTPSAVVAAAESHVLSDTVELSGEPPNSPQNLLLVGRSTELAAVSDPAAKRLLVTGEPGIGKTQLLDAASERWAMTERLVVRVDVSERPHRLLDPIAQLLEAVAENESIDDPLGVVNMLLPATGQQPEHLTSSRDEMIEGLVTVLARHLDEDCTIVVDDAQWLDGLSSDVLRQFSARSESQIVMAARTGLVGVELPAATQLDLQPLDLDTIEEWMFKELGESNATTCEALLHRSGGNPLFIRLLMDLLIDEVSEQDLPPTILATVKERVDGLGPEGRELVRVASALGPRVSMDVLAAFSLDIARALDETESAGLTRSDENGMEFVHGLVADAAAQLQGDGSTLAIHDQASRLSEDRGAPAEQYWRSCVATAVLDPARARRVAVEAATHYADVYAWDEAIECLEAARSLPAAAGQPPHNYEIDTQLARASFMTARPGDIELLESAILAAQAADDPAGEARAIAELAQRGCYALLGADPDPVVEHLKRGLSLPVDAVDRARLLAPAARALGYSRHHRVGQAHFRTAFKSLDEISDRRTRWTILRNAEYGLSDPASLELAESACSLMAQEMGHNHEISFLVGWTRYRHAVMRGDARAILQTQRATELAVDVLESQQQRLAYGHAYAVRFQLGQLHTSAALLAGDVDSAERHANDLLHMIGEYFTDAANERGKAWAMMGYAALMVGIRHAQGRLAELAPLAASQQSPVPAWRTAIIAAQFAAGDMDSAEAGLTDLAASDWEQIVPDQSYTGALWILAEPVAALLDQPDIESLYRLIHPWSDRWSLGGVVSFGPMSTAAAVLAEALGRGEEAAELRRRGRTSVSAMRRALS